MIIFKYFIAFIFVISTLSAEAQTYKAFVKAGDNALAQHQVYDAFQHFQMAMQIDSADVELWYKLAKAAHEFNLFETADFYYQKVETAGNASEVFRFGENWLQTKMALGDYRGASIIAKRYNLRDAEASINVATTLQSNPIKINIQHLDENINTPYSDFAAQKVGETLIYSSYRFKQENVKLQKDYTAKLISVNENGKGTPLKEQFNEADKSTANAFWQDENTVYYTICEVVNEQQHCEIYTRKRENGKWKNPEKLDPKINRTEFTATQPTIGFDSVDNKTCLYFVSDQSGKMTIWRSELLINGKWKTPTKMQVLDDRSANQNITPFFDNASQTLYFSSDRNNGLGGLDIYKIKRQKDGWSKAMNVGFPLNSSYNEVYFRLNEDGKTGYFSSNRKGSFTLTKKGSCCFDIYAFELDQPTHETPQEPIATPPLVTTEIPTLPTFPITNSDITTKSVEPIEPIEPVKPTEPVVNTTVPPTNETPLEALGKFLPLALYFHNDEPNPRTWQTTTTVNYATAFRNYYSLKKEYVQTYTKPLNELEKPTATNELNAFFDVIVKGGFDNLEAFSAVLLRYLQAGETFEIVLKGFASPRAKSDYNLNLSKRRVECIRNHFETYQNGIFSAYLNSGQLKITNSPFGEANAATSVSDVIDDKRNSVYSVSAAIERRVEILEVR